MFIRVGGEPAEKDVLKIPGCLPRHRAWLGEVRRQISRHLGQINASLLFGSGHHFDTLIL